jgi:hypothetical protein
MQTLQELLSQFPALLEKSIFLSYLLSFLGGFVSSLEPCLYVMIPVTIGFIASQAGASKLKSFWLSLIYVTGVAITYSTLGVVAAISGKVFGDNNCDHIRQPGENGIPGVTVTLTSGPTSPRSVVTDSSGNYKFMQCPKYNTYTVTETDPAGYCSTTPNVITVIVKKSNAPNNHFGDIQQVVSPPGGCCI